MAKQYICAGLYVGALTSSEIVSQQNENTTNDTIFSQTGKEKVCTDKAEIVFYFGRPTPFGSHYTEYNQTKNK